MVDQIPESLLAEFPQLKKIHEAITSFRETGERTVKCDYCDTIINVVENRELGFLETNCICGKSRTRDRWDPM